MGGSAEGFTVSPDALMRLGQALADLKAEFDRGVGGLDQLVGALGHQALQEKVRQFGENWSDKRAVISGQLEQAAGFAKQAADVYRTTDAEIAKALAPTAPTAPTTPAAPVAPPKSEQSPVFLQPAPPKADPLIDLFTPTRPAPAATEAR